MTETELQAIEHVTDRATGLPWRRDGRLIVSIVKMANGEDWDFHIGTIHTMSDVPEMDAEFCVMSRSAVPKLVAEVRELQTQIRAQEDCHKAAQDLILKRDSEITKLQKALEEIKQGGMGSYTGIACASVARTALEE